MMRDDATSMGDEKPLSHRQTMIWAGQVLDPDVPLYNMAHAFTLDLDIDVGAFERAFCALVNGSDAVRTVIGQGDGGPTQRVLPPTDVTMPIVDLSSQDDPDQAATVWVERRARVRFDLASCLYDSALLRLRADRYVWYLNQHHLITDAWSVSLLLRRQGELYQLALDGRLGEAEAMPRYEEFLQTEADDIGSKAHRKSIDYWADKLDESSEPLTFYGQRPDDLGHETVRVAAVIDGERAARLRQFLTDEKVAAQSPELTALRFFHTVLFAYLHRIGGAERISVGTPFHNRAKRQAKQTVGLFMNLFPVTAEIGRDDTMADLSAKVGAEIFYSMQHARFPVASSIEAGAIEVVLNYLHLPFETFGEHQVEDRWIHPGSGDRAHSLRLQVRRLGEDHFRLYFDVKTALFDEAQRRSLVEHFLRIVDGWLEDVDVPIGRLNLLSESEHERYISRFNAPTGPPVPDGTATPDNTVVADIERIAATRPTAVAVSGDGLTLSYDELNRRANRIANHLIAIGAGPGRSVGLLLPRGVDAVVAIVGILKSGARYLPAEPDTPAVRLEQMLTETGTRVICTDHIGASVSKSANVEPVVVSDVAQDEARPDHDPAVSISPDDQAYVIFTSGSTGRPKGVSVSHQGLDNYITWARRYYTGDQPRTFALFTSLAFDLTITSLFVPLTSGGSILIYPEDVDGGSPSVVEVWRDNRADVVKATPSHLTIVRQLGLSAPRLQTLIVGGEDLTSDLAAAVAEQQPSLAIYNEYGPTETVVGCMIHRFDPECDLWPSVPIGTPAANAEIFLLDSHGMPVPPGVVGEIHIGGPGVTAGYLERPEITAERFIDRPPALAGDQTRMTQLYRTGDLGRWRLGDGPPQLEFLGRADNQVKLRGYRVELGEIEAVLAAHPAVEGAAVAVVTETIGATAANPSAMESSEVVHCLRCGLPSNFPDATFEDEICSLCRDFDSYRHKVDEYFGDLDQLRAAADQIKAARPPGFDRDAYDCVVLLSGGKDSTYMLYQVVALGLQPLVFTLDNGFISPSALANCRRVCDHLGVDLEVASTEHMNEIFRDSLDRFSNVCNGCFKTIYTLSMNLARQHGLGYIVTGLARGQLFETRLSDMYNHQIFDVDKIDEYVLDARKAYHLIDDAVSRNLDVTAFENGRIYDEITFIDFYRYADVALDEVMAFLADETPWSRPEDTGRSTNCLINDVGIHVHNRERGFHNYALPYSWDVRLGHKQRDAALDELDDEIDEDFVNEVLVEIGYKPKPPPQERQTVRLVAHYQAAERCQEEDLRATLATALPDYMVPTDFVHHQQLPLTGNGKVDRSLLGQSESRRSSTGGPVVVAPQHERAAEALGSIWTAIFGRPVQLSDNFFGLGGDSITAIQIVDRAASVGLILTPRQLFEAQTLAGSASIAVWTDTVRSDEVAPTDRTDTTDAPGAGDATDEPTRGTYPLTPAQGGMLFHTLAEPSSGIYEGQIVHRLSGEVDAEILERCWHRLGERNPALRTVFRWQGVDQAQQVVVEEQAPFVRRRLTGEDEAVAEFLAEDRALGFDLATKPPVRLALLELPTQAGSQPQSQMVWSFHHVALDGWSIGLAVNELLDSYQAEVDGQDNPNGVEWSPSERQPFDRYLDWLANQDQAEAETFWRDELASFTTTTALPRSIGGNVAPEPADSGSRTEDGRRPYAASQRQLGEADSQRLRAFAGRERVTSTTVLQAAWGLVLARYEGTDDVVFGVTTSGRPANLSGAESMVGMLVNTLPARVRVPADREPGAWLRQIQDGQLAVRDHEYASLVDVQRWSELPPGQPLFNSILVVENFPDHQPPNGQRGLTIDARTYRVQSNYPLSLIVLPGRELTIKAVYDPEQFSGAKIDEILDHLEVAIDSLTSADAATVNQLSFVGGHEREQLERWSDGQVLELDHSTLLPDLIAAKIVAGPDEIAAVSGSDRLTYDQLGREADEVAAALLEAGVGPNAFVGVMLDRSLEMVVAIVGVLKAGAAYLPLDPSYPDERLRFMLSDAGAPVVIGGRSIERATAAGVGLQTDSKRPLGTTGLMLWSVDDAGAAIDPGTNSSTGSGGRRPIEADDLAYLIYTSGSTGKPNGVPIDHGNLAASTAARLTAYEHQPDSFLLLSSFSFDSSIVGIFWTLAAGGRLVLPKPGEELDIRVLSELIERESVSHTLCLPSLYRLLLDFSQTTKLTSLNTVIVAGEPCPRDLVEAHGGALPTAGLYNEYGPTEAAVWCTVDHCQPGETGPVPIGRAIPGATVAVLDRWQRPSGIGVPGEIFISGPGVARGYHRRPVLTAERFLEIDGRRWFRTRDIGTVRPDGRIEFGGRADSQVKIRGFRVELGEVESAIAAHPGVGEAVAVVIDGLGHSGSQLVAYVEPTPGSAPSTIVPGDLQATVRTRLPAVFVPARVVVVDSLPRLPNGKVDRSGLPGLADSPVEQTKRVPATTRERQLAEIWSDLLPGVSFGVDDDFFDIGGHSLLAVSLVERIRRATGAELPLASLLATPTVAALAQGIDEGRRTDAPQQAGSACLVPLRETGDRVPLYLIPPAAGTALSFRQLVLHTEPDQPLYCFEPVGNDGRSEPHETVEAMAECYVEKLREAQPDGRYRIAGSCLGAIVAWEMAQRLEAAGTPVELLIFLDPGPPHSGPGWSYSLPTQRSPAELVRSAIEIMLDGKLLTAARAVWRRNRFERIGRVHYRAQLSYVADRLEVPILWLQSSELAENEPVFLERWRVLAGDDLTPIVVADTTHDGLMIGKATEVERLSQELNRAIADFDHPPDSRTAQ